MADIHFEVCYQTWTAFARDCKQQLAMRGMFLKVPKELAQFCPVVLQLITPDGEECELSGDVIQSLPGKGLAVGFKDSAAAALEQLLRKCQENPPPPDEEAADPDPEVGQTGEYPSPPPGDGAAAPEGKMAMIAHELAKLAGEGKNLQAAVDKLSVTEKRQAALHGRKDVRLMLMRDRNKTIHPFVLKNPGLTLDEIEAFAKMPGVNPDALRMMANNKEWSRSASVCRNLVHNPKTPLKEALTLLMKLPLSDIRSIAKSSNVRAQLVQAARKKINV